MKKILIAFLVIAVIVIALAVSFAKPLMISVAKSVIEKALPGAKVAIAECSIRPASSVSLSGIKISRAGLGDIAIQNAGMNYEFSSLIKGRVRKAYVKGVSVNINSTSKKLCDMFLGRPGGPISPGLFVETIELTGVTFHVTIDGSNASGSMEMLFENMELLPKKIGLTVDSALAGPVRIKGLRFGAARAMGGGVFGIDSLKFNDINSSDVSGQPLLTDKGIVIDKIKAQVFKGKAEGVFSLTIDKEASYSLKMKVSGIDTHEAVLAFKLGERVDSTGSVKGELKVEGKGAVLTVVKGVFSVDENGGLFVIKDEEFLGMIAERTKQPIAIIKESFKDYRYNKGNAWLGLEGKDIHSGIALEGEKGKRNVDLVFHDIIK